MRNKKLILIMVFFVVTTFFLNGKTVIKGVEYFKGDDFVQLHFATDSIIPIPDLFYPMEDNFKFIVMRIEDVTFEGKTEKYFFNSPVIKEIELKSREKSLDVEIKLKYRVSSRVFSNRNGLYIEFPVLKDKSKTEVIPTPVRGKKIIPSVTEKKKEFRTKSVTKYSGKGLLKNVSFEKRKGNVLRFGIALSNKVNYKVIPIEKSPARLAIDLHNVRSAKINKKIGLLNVKGVRGAYNSSNIFRIVFDLNYLKEYNVYYNGSTLEVEFNKNSLAKNDPVKKPVKSIPVNSGIIKGHISKGAVIPANSIKDKSFVERLKRKGKVISESNSGVSGIVNDKGAGSTVKLNLKPEFFTEEKSDTEKKDPDNFISIKHEKGPSQIAYLKNTIDEGKKEYTGIPMDFSFKNADLTNVLKFIAQVSDLNIVIDPGVTGRISSELKQVPWDQALELFLKINSLDMILEGNILRIGNVEKLARGAVKRRITNRARQREWELEVITRKLSYAKATDVKKILSKQLSNRGEIVLDERTNMLIISEVSDNISTIDKLIDTLDSANPQVSIEAKIVETSTSFIKSLGIQWGTNFIADSFHGNQTNLSFPNSIRATGDGIVNQLKPGLLNPAGGGYAVNVPASGAPSGGIVFSLANAANTFQITTALTAMETQGKGRIISAPKITTQDNMEAKIVQGARIPIQTTQNNTVTVRYENAALELVVTPHITAKGTIVMDVSIKNDYPDWGNTVLGNPQIITQEVVDTVTSNDGGTIVIGGIFKVEDSNSSDKVPFLSKIPLIGALFKNSNKRRDQKELLIFLTPRIVK